MKKLPEAMVAAMFSADLSSAHEFEAASRLRSVVKQQQTQEDRATEREGCQNNVGLEHEIEHGSLHV